MTDSNATDLPAQMRQAANLTAPLTRAELLRTAADTIEQLQAELAHWKAVACDCLESRARPAPAATAVFCGQVRIAGHCTLCNAAPGQPCQRDESRTNPRTALVSKSNDLIYPR